MNDNQLIQMVERIPGNEGWTKSDGEAFMRLAIKLARAGVSEAEIVKLLTDAYRAVADEYGD